MCIYIYIYIYICLPPPSTTLSQEVVQYRLGIDERGAASPDAVAARCKHFAEDKCGGCAFQHLAYPAQLREKHALVALRLRQYGVGDELLAPPLPSPAEFGFHGRTQGEPLV